MDKNECVNCGGGLIITPAYPVADRTIYCENCGLTPKQAADESIARLQTRVVQND